MNLYDRGVIVFAKIIAMCLRGANLGSGATWPGEIALRFSPGILEKFTRKDITIIVVAGTNGKTTTAKMIDTILTEAKKPTARNQSGANLDNGVVSSFIEDATVFGNLRSRYFIFEVDEATLPNILHTLHPSILILLNIFRDQLDRYGEVDTIASKWLNAIKNLTKKTQILINGDDPQLAFLGRQLKDHHIQYFGLNDPELFLPHMEHATDSIYCPQCGNRLTFGGVYFSHLGKWACGQCGFMHPEMAVTARDFSSPLEGVYNQYNTLAAALAGRLLGFSDTLIQQALSSFTPAFGRMEEITVHRRRMTILLSKNPTGLNESLRTVLSSEKAGSILLILNDKIPDGKDVSWIWDADLEILKGYEFPVVVCGERCFDLALRIKYAGISPEAFFVFEHMNDAVDALIKNTKADEHIWILPTYSAMLEIRKVLLGRKIL
jgi:UDP-N-acetylmuramyl tripeptide synthase